MAAAARALWVRWLPRSGWPGWDCWRLSPRRLCVRNLDFSVFSRVFSEAFCFALPSCLKRDRRGRRVWLRAGLVENLVLLFEICTGNEEEANSSLTCAFASPSASSPCLPLDRMEAFWFHLQFSVEKNIAAFPRPGLGRGPGCDAQPAADLCVVRAWSRRCWCQG